MHASVLCVPFLFPRASEKRANELTFDGESKSKTVLKGEKGELLPYLFASWKRQRLLTI